MTLNGISPVLGGCSLCADPFLPHGDACLQPECFRHLHPRCFYFPRLLQSSGWSRTLSSPPSSEGHCPKLDLSLLTKFLCVCGTWMHPQAERRICAFVNYT